MSHATASVSVDTRCRDFLEQVGAATRRVLMIDYDGTVAPFATDRSRAFPYPKVPKLLEVIMKTCSTRVIMITGGPAHRVGPLLGIHPSPETWGAYGLERLSCDGYSQGVEISDETFDALARAEQLLEDHGLSQSLEVSPGGVAIHWRGLSAQEILEVRSKAYRILNPLTAHAGLVVADFDGGVEIRLASASTGDAARSVLSEIESDVPVAYLGDDTPDEDAFRILNDRGLTALVRPKYRFTAAQLWFRPPEELSGFLSAWIGACGGASCGAAVD